MTHSDFYKRMTEISFNNVHELGINHDGQDVYFRTDNEWVNSDDAGHVINFFSYCVKFGLVDIILDKIAENNKQQKKDMIAKRMSELQMELESLS